MFVKIDDKKILHCWRCSDPEGCDAKPENKEVFITPTFYQQNGTPVCECGCDMTYSHTEVDIENYTNLILKTVG